MIAHIAGRKQNILRRDADVRGHLTITHRGHPTVRRMQAYEICLLAPGAERAGGRKPRATEVVDFRLSIEGAEPVDSAPECVSADRPIL